MEIMRVKYMKNILNNYFLKMKNSLLDKRFNGIER